MKDKNDNLLARLRKKERELELVKSEMKDKTLQFMPQIWKES